MTQSSLEWFLLLWEIELLRILFFKNSDCCIKLPRLLPHPLMLDPPPFCPIITNLICRLGLLPHSAFVGTWFPLSHLPNLSQSSGIRIFGCMFAANFFDPYFWGVTPGEGPPAGPPGFQKEAWFKGGRSDGHLVLCFFVFVVFVLYLHAHTLDT